MNVTIKPGKLSGTITPPPSKSQAHRAVIAAALAEGESRIRNIGVSQDISATMDCMAALGAQIRLQGDVAVIRGAGRAERKRLPELPCGESGSTLRFLIPVALALAGGGVFRGQGRLMRRPQDPYFEIFREKGIAFSLEHDTLKIKGTLTPGIYRLPGNVSSQFVTGLLYALPLLEGDSVIVLTTELESAGYIDMTIDVLWQFGVTVEQTAGGWRVPGRQIYRSAETAVEADYSQAAFYLAAAGMGNPLQIVGMNPSSRQGDRVMGDLARRLSEPGETSLDVRGCPDLVPALAALAALRRGETTRIIHAGRLRLKESDRLVSVGEVLGALSKRSRKD